MFYKCFLAQLKFNLKQRTTQAVFYFLLIIVGTNFVINVITFQGTDVVSMYNPMKLLLLSYNRVYFNADMTLFFVQLFPLLVSCPAGLALARENQTGIIILGETRTGGLTYRFSKLAASFTTTAIVFTVPFVVEIALNCVAFPISATGDLSNMNLYNEAYIQKEQNYLFFKMYLMSPYLCALSGTLVFGLVSGVLAAFSEAFSSVVEFKYRLLYLLPVFILLNSTIYLQSSSSKVSVKSSWYHYMLLFDDQPKQISMYIGCIILLICFSLLATFLSGRKDRLG